METIQHYLEKHGFKQQMQSGTWRLKVGSIQRFVTFTYPEMAQNRHNDRSWTMLYKKGHIKLKTITPFEVLNDTLIGYERIALKVQRRMKAIPQMYDREMNKLNNNPIIPY